jgi:hypothetical protein
MENLQKDLVTYNHALRLKALGFDEPCLFLYNSSDDEPKPFLANPPEPMYWNSLYVKNTNKHLMSAPTIAEVVMWLYEKHGIWTVVNVNIMGSWYFEHFDLKEKRNAEFKPTDTHYNSPTEAYEAAIEYTLNNLI